MILSQDKFDSLIKQRAMNDISGQIYNVTCNIIVTYMRYSINKDTQF